MMADAHPASARETSGTSAADAASIATPELLAELARRFRIRYGRLEILFHDSRPSPRVLVEHRIQQALDELKR